MIGPNCFQTVLKIAIEQLGGLDHIKHYIEPFTMGTHVTTKQLVTDFIPIEMQYTQYDTLYYNYVKKCYLCPYIMYNLVLREVLYFYVVFVSYVIVLYCVHTLYILFKCLSALQ